MNRERQAETELIQLVGECYYDPLLYVNLVFPWGAKNTLLEKSKGPRDWQRGFLVEWGQEIRIRNFDGITPVDPIEFSTVSGHGIGKSALTAFCIKFIHDTRPHSKGIVTANTSDQLKTKTWAELGKWHRLSLTRHWSEYFTSRGNMALVNTENPESWRVDAQTCREENSEAFAGNHSSTSTPFYIFDEASAIPNPIWEVSDGGLTDGEAMRLSFGNGTKNSGRFRDCHGKLKHRVITRNIDSRDVEGTNHKLFKNWEEDFGSDSDFFRVRVKGMFPRQATTQFISNEIVFAAQKRTVVAVENEPVVLGVDVARFGDDKSVIYTRHGRDARTFTKKEFRGIATTRLTTEIILHIRDLKRQGIKVSAVFIDGNGVGGGVVDQCISRGVACVIDVQVGEGARDSKKYANKRAECFGLLREWLKGASIPKDAELENGLVSIEYGFDRKNRILLESKDSMKSRGLPSPDDADAIAITFAEPVIVDTKYPETEIHAVHSDEDPHAY